MLVTGFGAAFSLHFTSRRRISSYRELLDDDGRMLRRFLGGMLDEGVFLLPDGRFYVSAAHTGREVDETVLAARRVLASCSKPSIGICR